MRDYTPRERAALTYFNAGKRIKEIAPLMGISETRAGVLVRNARAKEYRLKIEAERKAQNIETARKIFQLWSTGQIGF